MLSWILGERLPGVADVVAHGDQLRELVRELQQQRQRISGASALRSRMQTAAASTKLGHVRNSLIAVQPFATPVGDKLLQAVEAAIKQHGVDCPVGDPLPTDLAVFITTNCLSETTAVASSAAEIAAELTRQLSGAAAKLAGPSLDAVVNHRIDAAFSDGVGGAVISLAHLPLGDAAAKRVTSGLQRSAFVGLLDLTGCMLPSTLAVDELLPALRSLQHLSVLSLAHNQLAVGVGSALREALADPEFCPSLVAICLQGNDFAADDVSAIAELLEQRVKHRVTRSASTLADRPDTARVLALDGGGMQAALQLEWLERRQRDMRRHGKHIAEDFDVVVATGWGAVIACALAMRRPLAAVEAFFERCATRVFAENPTTYYAEKVARAARGWWTNGNFYSKPELAAALEELFGEARFDFATTNVIIMLGVMGRDAKPDASPRLRLASAWRCEAPPLRELDVIDHALPAPRITDVLLAALSTATCFAASAIYKDSAELGMDATGLATSPALFGVLEGVRFAPTVSLTSVSAFPAPLDDDPTVSTASVIAATLDAFPAERDSALVRLSTVAKYSAVATSAVARAISGAVPRNAVRVHRAVLQLESESRLAVRVDEGSAEHVAAVRESVRAEESPARVEDK